jgi:hypothetical protein
MKKPTGQAIKSRQEQDPDPVVRWMAATLDDIVASLMR